MKKLSVMIVDDSAVFRRRIREVLESVANVEIAGTASNGKLALAQLQLKPADVVTLDLEMPEMNGLDALVEIRKHWPTTRVVVFSSHSQRGAESTFKALSLGAHDFVAKPGPESTGLEAALDRIKADLVPKILDGMTPPLGASPPKRSAHPFTRLNDTAWETFKPEVTVIGSSTGGPSALEAIFSNLKGPLRRPILIAQHMPPIFTKTLAERLAQCSGVPLAEARHGEPLRRDRAYIAPGDFHLRVVRDADGVKLLLSQEGHRNSVRPAVDYLFESAADVYGHKCGGMILTGMGQDGLDGSIAIKSRGGAMLIQDRASCVVFGMPGAVFEAGAYDRIGSLAEIGLTLKRWSL